MACRMALLAVLAMAVMCAVAPHSAEARKMLQTPGDAVSAIASDITTHNYSQLTTDINAAADQYLHFSQLTGAGTGHWQALPFGYHTGGGIYTGEAITSATTTNQG